jgi:predicted ester cyclase
LTISGTQQGQWGSLPATGKRAQVDEIVILQIRDSKILSQRGIVDNLSALSQLGAVPSRDRDRLSRSKTRRSKA